MLGIPGDPLPDHLRYCVPSMLCIWPRPESPRVKCSGVCLIHMCWSRRVASRLGRVRNNHEQTIQKSLCAIRLNFEEVVPALLTFAALNQFPLFLPDIFHRNEMAEPIDPSILTPEYLAADEGPEVLRTITAITAISTLFFGLRVAVRLRRSGFGIGADDWFLFAAVVRTPMCVLSRAIMTADLNILLVFSVLTGLCMGSAPT